MKRHDTHLLSSDSEKEEKEEEDAHQYSFSNSSSESSKSNKNLISKEIIKKSPIKINIENAKNDSIISVSELEDIFHGKKESKVDEKKKKKSKPKTNKLFIKLKKVKLNNEKDGDLVEYCLTYNPKPNYDTILDNSSINLKQSDNNNNNVNNRNEAEINFPKLNTDRAMKTNNENKNSINNSIKEKEILYFFYNDDNEGNKKLKRVINIINKQKSQLYKISDKNCFTIKTSKIINNVAKPSPRTRYQNPFMENNKNNGIERYNQIRRQRMSNSAKNKFILRKNKNYLFKENNKNNNLDLSLQNPNKVNYYQSISNKKHNKNNNDFYKYYDYQNFKNDRDKILYNLYVGKNEKKSNNYNNMFKKQRIKSTDSLINRRQMQRMNTNLNMNMNLNNILEREDYHPEYIRYMEIHNREKENRKIIKNMFRQAGHNYQDFSRHVGNDLNCPICQAMQMKNENSIKIKGIQPMVSSMSNNSTQNSWQNRRIYSALSRILTKRKIEKTGCRSTNISHTLNINKSKNMSQKNNNNISNISKISSKKFNNNYNNKDKIENHPFRKLNINRSGIDQNKFPNSNKVINFKNKNIKYN